MKKILLGFMLILSINIFADYDPYEGQEDIIENNLKINKKILSDGKVRLEKIDYDVDIYEDNIVISLEVESKSSKKNWNQFNKEIFDNLMDEIAQEVRIALDKKDIPVNISLEVEGLFDDEELVYNKTF